MLEHLKIAEKFGIEKQSLHSHHGQSESCGGDEVGSQKDEKVNVPKEIGVRKQQIIDELMQSPKLFKNKTQRQQTADFQKDKKSDQSTPKVETLMKSARSGMGSVDDEKLNHNHIEHIQSQLYSKFVSSMDHFNNI